MSLSTIVLILSFVVFVVAALGWKWRKVELISVGLALLVLSMLLGSVHLS